MLLYICTVPAQKHSRKQFFFFLTVQSTTVFLDPHCVDAIKPENVLLFSSFHILHCLDMWSNGNGCKCSPQYSLGDLEEMMLCLQQFCSVLSNMEEQLSEDQASVYSALSEQDRYTL